MAEAAKSVLSIADSAVIGAKVSFDGSAKIGDWVSIGTEGEGETAIGDDACIRSGTIIYANNVIGRNFSTGHRVNVREANVIGDDVSIGTATVIEHHVEIRNGVRIHSQAFIPEFSVLEEGVWIGPNVVITNAKYPAAPDTKENLLGCRLKKGCKIGANATILPGVIVGENALVGAGSVVTKDVPDNMIVAGSPAQVIRPIGDVASYKDNLK